MRNALGLVIAGLLLSISVICYGQGGAVGITIDLKAERQVMHSFGASDAWTCQFIGKNWALEKRQAIADLLFSQKTDDKGNPKGIGLTMWRFNIGAGSAEQGSASKIWSQWNRAECFRNADGSYDWTKQAGQRWFAEAAKAQGVKYLLGFTNSPPVQFTTNGIAHMDKGVLSNISKDAMPKFADFLVDVAAHFKEIGLPFDYLSPVNEPQFGWEDQKQEGLHASNEEMFEIARLLGQGLHERGLNTKVALGESGILYYLISPRGGNTAADQVNVFWNPSSPQCLAKVPNVAHIISSHAYFTTWPVSKQVQLRDDLRKRVLEIDPKLAYWESEYCLMENNPEISQGHGRDLGMNTALYVARLIHSDLAIGNASSWSWWLAVAAGDYKDGLVYVEPMDSKSDRWSQLERDGQVLDSKLLWAVGNFSRFVRPGMVRVNVGYDDNRSLTSAAESVMASAYVDKKARRLVVVLVNCTKDRQGVRISNLGSGLKVRGNVFYTYTTSETSDLSKSSTPADSIVIPARSVVTLVGRVQ